MTSRALAWEWIGCDGCENLALDIGPDGIVAVGDIAASLGAEPFRLHYHLACDSAWRFRAASLSVERDDRKWTHRGSQSREKTKTGGRTGGHERSHPVLEAAMPRALHIARAADGAWRVNGEPRPDLAGAAAIDIMATPLTNTLPIRTLAFHPGVPIRVTVAYVTVPSLAVTTQEQEYTELAPGRFRYRGLATGFTAELEVDDEGLVLRYGTIWRRV
ncbi:MAG TPA: putative glycolipid-binding domain-containing protein [Acetobacteraceae bacterium]|nr:putative glycolipid-binding domain-containing protein [Acetobacteraceae bacterium]